MKRDLSPLSMEDLRKEEHKRLLEINSLRFTEFNPRHRDLYLRLHGNVEKIRAEMNKRAVGEDG